jgi:aerobic-type carbon monoxide dehydrogenase small subunit (CoxS/CutS family)
MTETLTIRFRLNGRAVEAAVAPYETLVEALRRCFQLHGARESCGQGICGTCTVVVDDRAVSGCLTLAATVDGADVLTIEGLGTPERLHAIQQAYVDASGFQCGFCTPGMVLMTRQLLAENPHPTDEEIKHYLAGSICRCAAYPEIIDAVKLAAGRLAAPQAEAVPAGTD